MRNDLPNNQHSQKQTNEISDPKEEDDTLEKIILLLIVIVFLPIFAIRVLMPVLYSNSKTWRVFEWRRNAAW